MKFAGVVLAAGRSTRMGSNKLLADFNGQCVIVTTVKEIQASGVDDVIVVTGHQAVEIEAALQHFNVKFIHNAAYSEGLSTSIRAGITAAKNFAGAFMCLGDMPLIRAGDLARMMAAFSASENRRLIAPTCGGKLGNPVLWGAEYFPALMSLEGDRGARNLLDSIRAQVTEIAVEHDGIMRDADTPEALREMRQTGNRISK